MKRIVSLVLALAMVLTMSFVGTVSAVATATIAGDTVSGPAGTRVAVPVYINNADAIKDAGNGTICGVQFTMNYDTDALQFVKAKGLTTSIIDGEDVIENEWQTDYKEYTDKDYNAMVMINDQNKVGVEATGIVRVATLYFNVLEDAVPGSSYDIDISVVEVCDSEAAKLTENVIGGKATISVPELEKAAITAKNVVGYAGSRVTVPLTIYDADRLASLGNGTVCGIEVNLYYNVDKLTFVSARTPLKYVVEDGEETVEYPWTMDAKELLSGAAKVMVSDSKNVGVTAENDILFANVFFTIADSVPVGTEITVTVSLVDICDSNSGKLGALTKTEDIKITVADATDEQVNAVVAAISELGTITIDKADAITAARTLYDALTDEQKANVTNYDTLTAAETSISHIKNAKAVTEAIALIPNPVYKSDRFAVASARLCYASLTDEEKALVVGYDKLTAAEAEIARLSEITVGDVEGDGKVTVSDVVVLRKNIISGINTATPEQMAAIDLNDDGLVTVSDVIELRKYIIAGAK